MQMKGLETLVGKTITRVDFDSDFEQGGEVLTLTFDDGTEAQFSSTLAGHPDERLSTEIGFFIEGYKGVVAVPD